MEVLVAIFVMGIGLLAILALFPLGALSMAQAIQDDRAGHLGLNGAALAQGFGLRNDPEVVAAFTNPGGGLPPPHPDYPSYPVFLDAIGLQTYVNAFWVGDSPPAAGSPLTIPRRAADLARTAGQLDSSKIWQWFTLLDDLKFGTNGTPANPLEREGTLSYGLMFRRPRSSVANVVELSVVVYSRRPLTPQNDLLNDEYAYVGQFNTPSTNLITIDSTGRRRPTLRPGSWVLDATFKQAPSLPGDPAGVSRGYAYGYFYRVVNVTEVSPNQFELELATPLRGWPAAGNGTIIVMDSVIEVIEKGSGW
jgi:hypothetical protein